MKLLRWKTREEKDGKQEMRKMEEKDQQHGFCDTHCIMLTLNVFVQESPE